MGLRRTRALYLLPVLWLAAATPALALSSSPYLVPGKLDILHLVPPPPAPNSPEQRRDERANLNLQNARSDAEAERAYEDAQVSIFRFSDVLGPNFTKDKIPGVVAFLAKADRERATLTNLLKDCWERPRPFVANADVHPVRNLADTVADRPGTKNTAPHDAASGCRPLEPSPAYSYSYPSGHSTFGVLTAILLAQMVPEKREKLYARGWEYGRNRVIGGVHFLSDVEAGRITATLIASQMMENPEFNADLDSARKELRQALGLPDER
jgi:acid phosphatase (class A)